MKKSNLITIIVCAVIGLIAIFIWARYNALVSAEMNVEKGWAEVQNQYQRRLDLIPNLVKTVSKYTEYEQATLTAVTKAREDARKVQVDPKNATAEQLAAYDAAQHDVDVALRNIDFRAIMEAYPDLKADKEFTRLMDELSGTENRIANARNLFINFTTDYNTMRRRFPTNIVAGMFGFEERAFFQATEGADKAPEVDFE